jgi:hypothetical protein
MRDSLRSPRTSVRFAHYSRTTRMKKKKRKQTYLSPDFYARGEENRRILTERLELHRRLREQRRAARGEQPSAGD